MKNPKNTIGKKEKLDKMHFVGRLVVTFSPHHRSDERDTPLLQAPFDNKRDTREHRHLSATKMFTLSAPLPSTRKPIAIEGRHFTKKKKTCESVCFFPKERWARGNKRGDGFVVRSTDSEDAARKLLGISDNDDALAVQQAVNKKKMLYKGDNEKLKEVEAAYDTLQQASLQARLSGKKVESQSVLNADRIRSKWQPRWCPSPNKDLFVNYGIALACFIVTWAQPHNMRSLQLTIFGSIAMAFRMFIKLVDVDPGPNPKLDQAGAAKHNNMRFARSFVFCIGGFAASVFAFYWLPNLLIETLNIKVPLWALLEQELGVSFLTLSSLATLVTFYR